MSELDRLNRFLGTNGYTKLTNEHLDTSLHSLYGYSGPRGRAAGVANNHQRLRGIWLGLPWKVLAVMKWAILLASSLVAACIAASGFLLLAGLLVTRSLSPSVAYFEKELFFDYTQPEAAAVAAFVTPSNPVKASAARFLQPGTSINVWLELVVPDSHGDFNGDMFQVKAELVAADGRAAAHASRPCMITYRSPLVRSIRMLAILPLTLTGWHREQQVLRVPLFKRYRERLDVPFAVFRATLQARSKGELPRLYGASVHVDLNLGPIRRMMFLLRPGDYLTWGLASAGLTALAGGGLASIALLVLWGLSGGGGGGAAEERGNGGKAAPRRHSEEVSSEAGWSEVSSGELESESEREGAPASEPAESPVTPLSAQALKRWDARSASAHSLVSSEGASLHNDDASLSRQQAKKLR